MYLSGVKGLTVYKSDPRLLTIQVDPAVATNSKKKVKSTSTFLCGSERDRDRMYVPRVCDLLQSACSIPALVMY
jgi:hypothetical protein